MEDTLVIKFNNDNPEKTEKIINHFKDWFKSYGEFKLLDYIDTVDPKLDYGEFKFELTGAVKDG